MVTTELIFSIELVEAIAHKSSKKSGSKNVGETWRKHPYQSASLGNSV